MAAPRNIRSLQTKHAIKSEQVRRDPSPAGVKIMRWLKNPTSVTTSLFVTAATAFLVPGVSDIALIAAGGLTAWALRQKEDMPLKMPIQSGLPDMNDRMTPQDKPGAGKGIFFFGNRWEDNKQLWITNDDCRQHFLVLGTTGSGKALPLDAPVHTPTGWRPMGMIRVGDLVSTPDGRSAPVTGYYPQGELDIYEIEFEDGRVAEACPEHLWEVHHKHWNGKYKPGVSRAGMAKPRLLRTLEVKELLERHAHNPSVKFSVRLAQPVEKPVGDLPLSPYLVGALIGDGNLTQWSLRMTSEDAHILEAVDAGLAEVGHELRRYPSARPYDWNIASITNGRKGPVPGRLRAILRTIGLEDKAAHEKRIPRAYLDASVAQRWEILRGLMDTDGSAGTKGVSLSFSTSSPGLADDVVELVRSLGGIAKQARRTTYYRDRHGNRKAGRPSYRISMRHPEPAQFFTLPRKVETVSAGYQYADSLKLHFKEIRLKRRAQAACIMVDHPDHLFVTKDYVVTHNTENLLGFVTNALTWSSGFLFCDGKGDVSLFAKVFALARRFGREDDLLVLNMMTGNADVGGGGGHLLSNTLNPFATGSSDGLTQLVVGLMDEVGGDGAMWKGRATAMFTGVMKAMVYLRDQGTLDLNVGEIRDHLNLRRIIDLANPEKNPGISEDVRHSIRSYLTSLPGYQEEKGYKQAQTTLDQHGYLEMQFTKILGSLADVYGHVFKTPYGEIDMQDVVLNRRILVVMLPALEKSGDELANLGKIVVATLKGMMGSALGNRIEGSWDDIVDNRVTNSPSPFLVVLDEVGYYTVEGLALMAAQARSLGFSMIYASQDIPAMKRLNEKEAASIIANTNTKIFMRTEEMEVTGDLAEKSGGMGIRAETGGYGGRIGELGNAYSDNLEARFNSVTMVDKLDLKDFGAGDMLVMFKAEKVFARTFHADPPKAVKVGRLKLRANHFVKIAKPSRSELETAAAMTTVLSRLVEADLPARVAERDKAAREGIDYAAEAGDEIAVLSRAFRDALAAKIDPKEAACAALFDVSYAVAGAAAQFSEHRTAHASKPRDGLADSFPAAPLDLDDEPYGDPGGAPPPRDAFDDYNPYPGQGGLDGFDLEGAPPPARGGFDPLAGLDDAQERPPRNVPPRGPRRPTSIQEAQHVITIDDRELDGGVRVDSSDSVLRVLADFDFDPNRTSAEDIEQRIQEATGAPTDLEGLQNAEPDHIDHTAYEADRAADSGSRPVAESRAKSHEDYISGILAELMDDGRED